MAQTSKKVPEARSRGNGLLDYWVGLRLWGRPVRSHRDPVKALTPRIIERLEDRCLMSAAEPGISEFLAKNNTVLADQDGDFEDWIEIHNPSASAVSLNGWSLTDDPTALTKWQFPNITLAANEYSMIFVDPTAAEVG